MLFVFGRQHAKGVVVTEQLPRYIPTPPPAKLADAPAWIQRELNKIARVLAAGTTTIEDLQARVEDLEDAP